MRTNLLVANTAKTLHELGFESTYISKILKLPESTTRDILMGRREWDRLLAHPELVEHRTKQRELIKSVSLNLAQQALTEMERRLPKASLNEALDMYRAMTTLVN